MEIVDTTKHADRLNAFPSLILNADFKPVKYLPLSTFTWKEAISNTYSGNVIVVKEHDIVARSPSIEIRLPAVVAMRKFIHRKEIPALSRHNLLVLRDKSCCAYCGMTFKESELTIDHVLPRSKGGKHRWENTLASCRDCNSRKDNKLCSEIGMHPLWRPWLPSVEQLARQQWFDHKHKVFDAWKEFIPFADETN